jgi:uncharacterized membrane protein YkvA (DUF1232 family)
VKDLFRMFGAWATLRYRTVPWLSILLLIALLLYLFSPFDLIPDFIPGVGVVDDIALFGFLFRSLMRDARRFRTWEGERASPRLP